LGTLTERTDAYTAYKSHSRKQLWHRLVSVFLFINSSIQMRYLKINFDSIIGIMKELLHSTNDVRTINETRKRKRNRKKRKKEQNEEMKLPCTVKSGFGEIWSVS
jgi:hypothetical protein